MVKSAFSMGPGARVTMMGRIPSGPGSRVMGGTRVQILVLAQVASTMSVRSGGGGWHRIRNKDRYRTSGVRWCRVVGLVWRAIVLLSADTGRRGKGSACRPSRKGFDRG
ncbi:hypothetical protein TIFTF001_027932 [Ficus carica]|uniref:Uncharacterized protein n=1 Tax=Ficus carica TaxID=3494 RepID=A0AA88IVS1_FICCA|nr:hypothetical protein TIFTF001_027932 [Ficus carica]